MLAQMMSVFVRFVGKRMKAPAVGKRPLRRRPGV